MKITKIEANNNISYKSLKVSYGAEGALRKLPISAISDLLDVGRALSKTEYVDLEVLSNLKFRITEKGKPFSGITEPIKVIKPEYGEKRIKLTGIYDGKNSDNKKHGDSCNLYIDYVSYAQAIKGYNILQNYNSRIERMFLLTKEIDRSRMLAAEHENSSAPKNNISLCTVLMDKYADIVREH